MIRAVYMGSEGFSVPPLHALWHQGPGLETPVCLVGIVTQPDRRSGRGRGLKTNAVKQFGLEHQIPVIQPETLRESGGEAVIATMRPDLLVVASYGQILPRRILDMPPLGCLNLHPSLLPRHRGPSPVVGALLAGDSVTGVCLMQMTTRMDAGPVVACQHMAIPGGITAGDLTGALAEMAASLLLDELPAWISGHAKPETQNDAEATYTRLLTKQDGRVDWSKPACLLSREVLAFNPWPVAHTMWGTQQVRLLRAECLPGQEELARVVRADADGLLIGTGDGILRVTELQLAGRRPVSARDFLAGNRDILGVLFHSAE